ncbi:hypothetical protein Gotur_031173 [Gossypium turneri]
MIITDFHLVIVVESLPIKKLKQLFTIFTIKDVLLDVEEQSMTSTLIKDWLEKLKDAFYDADDWLDDFC